MPDPTVVRLGNCRFAGLPSPGWPVDALALAAQAAAAVAAHPGEPAPAVYGAAMVWIAVSPRDLPPTQWDCLVGHTITGMVQPAAITTDGQRLLVEDYRQLTAYCLTHQGSIRDLAQTHARLAAAATAAGRQVRPYWRVALRARTLADGNLLPQVDVHVFVA